jgi:hypothetical protein
MVEEQLAIESFGPDVIDEKGDKKGHIGHYKDVMGQDVEYQ